MKDPTAPTGRRKRQPSARASAEATLGQVALSAGVSPSTVSRILNGTAVVSAEKREAVDRAIAELGFVPNPVARGLAGGRTLSIGVITPSLDSPFYGGALRGIEDALGRAGYSPLFVSGHGNASHESRCIEVLRARRVDGLIALSGRLSDSALTACARHLPVVVTGRTLKAKARGLYAMDFDNFTGARLATRHLIGLGHRRIAFIAGDSRHPDATERLRGYRAELKEAGIAFSPALVVPGQFLEDSGRVAAEGLIESREPFSAIFAANDQMAQGAALALHRHGLKVPQDVSLVGFDDQAASTFSLPPLSTVHHPSYELGQIASGAMLQLLAGETPRQELPAPRFIERESTARRRA